MRPHRGRSAVRTMALRVPPGFPMPFGPGAWRNPWGRPTATGSVPRPLPGVWTTSAPRPVGHPGHGDFPSPSRRSDARAGQGCGGTSDSPPCGNTKSPTATCALPQSQSHAVHRCGIPTTGWNIPAFQAASGALPKTSADVRKPGTPRDPSLMTFPARLIPEGWIPKNPVPLGRSPCTGPSGRAAGNGTGPRGKTMFQAPRIHRRTANSLPSSVAIVRTNSSNGPELPPTARRPGIREPHGPVRRRHDRAAPANTRDPAALPITVPRLPSDRRGTLRTVPPAGNRRGRLRPPQSRSPSCRACTGSRTGRHPAAGRHGHHDGSARGPPEGGTRGGGDPGSAPDSGTAQAFPSWSPGRPRSSSAAANPPRGGAPMKDPVPDGTRSRRGCAVNRDRSSADADPPPVIAPLPKPACFGAAVR